MISLPVPEVGNWRFVLDESTKVKLRRRRCLISLPKKKSRIVCSGAYAATRGNSAVFK
jgi:hypothetical protein